MLCPLDWMRPRVCVFIHGLACDEQSWSMRADAWKGSAWEHVLPTGTAINYGMLLAAFPAIAQQAKPAPLPPEPSYLEDLQRSLLGLAL